MDWREHKVPLVLKDRPDPLELLALMEHLVWEVQQGQMVLLVIRDRLVLTDLLEIRERWDLRVIRVHKGPKEHKELKVTEVWQVLKARKGKVVSPAHREHKEIVVRQVHKAHKVGEVWQVLKGIRAHLEIWEWLDQMVHLDHKELWGLLVSLDLKEWPGHKGLILLVPPVHKEPLECVTWEHKVPLDQTE
jgi:hypothetical protein